MAIHDSHLIDFTVFMSNILASDDDIITALEALGCIVIGIRRDEPLKSQFITCLPIRPSNTQSPLQ